MPQDSKQAYYPQRSCRLFMLEVKDDDNKVVGHGYALHDAINAGNPILADFDGNPLPQKLYDLRVLEDYICVSNGAFH